MKNKKILHITPHVGGGPGNVIIAYILFEKSIFSDNKHSIASLDYANDKSKNICNENNIELFEYIYKDYKSFLDKILNYDIIIMHFWNHPLIYDFIVRNKIPKSRIILWSHTSGFAPPSVFTDKILEYPDLFVLSSPISFETNEIKNYKNRNKIKCISSTSGVDKLKDINLEKHDNFNILYIGTVDFSKLYKNFIELCNKINIPNIKFIVCGGPNHLELEKQTKYMNIENKFQFLGKVDNIEDHIKISDIFGYPLSKNHYGTTDQVLIEAMSSGLPVVAFDNPMEKYMVKEDCGIICSNEKEYINAIEKLYRDEKLRKKFGINAKKYAINEYSIDNMSNKWNTIFDDIIKMDKKERNWKIEKNKELTALDIFYESIGEYKNIFYLEENKLKIELNKPNWYSNSTGTPKQYNSFFPDGSIDKIIKLYK